MKWFLYNAIFAVLYVLILPKFLLRMCRRGGYRSRFTDRFGRYPDEVISRIREEAIWIHAVSVGEVSVAGQLMKSMREVNPQTRFVFSTTSSTGWKQAEKHITANDVLIYNPLDFPCCVKRAFNIVRPKMIILTESEIWPNFIRQAVKRRIPLYLVNARVSDRSAPRYAKLRMFFGEIFSSFTKIYAQSDMDAKRLVAAGATSERIEVTGSFKFDVARRNESKEKELASWIAAGSNWKILLGGSTWPGEDKLLLDAYKKILLVDDKVRLVLAPRHFEKADDVERNIRAAGFDCVRRSRGETLGDRDIYSVLLADTTGELMGLYGNASVAFVGKSMYERGGQNMIEPCACGIATVVGPHTENFRSVMSDLLAAEAVLQVDSEAGLKDAVISLLTDGEKRESLGERAVNAVHRRLGVVGRCAKELAEMK